jgi:hypothetical protein
LKEKSIKKELLRKAYALLMGEKTAKRSFAQNFLLNLLFLKRKECIPDI